MRTNKNVRGIIIREGKVLLIHRFKNGDEYWVVPGGGVEEGETLEEALKREMLEETGLAVVSFELLSERTSEEKTQYIYKVEMEGGEAHLGGPEEADSSENNKYILTWVEINEAKSLKSLYPEMAKEYF